MMTYCLKCKKDTESVDLKFFKIKKGKTMFHQNVLYVVVKNQNL